MPNTYLGYFKRKAQKIPGPESILASDNVGKKGQMLLLRFGCLFPVCGYIHATRYASCR